LNLPAKGAIVLSGAESVNDSRKGMDLLQGAVRRLDQKARDSGITLLLFGRGTLDTTGLEGITVRSLGYVKDSNLMPVLYSAADVMVVPSRQESFGQTATEAMACGTPVAAFAVGGLLDIVTHGQDGWLAQPFDVDAMAQAIRDALAADGGAIRGKTRDKALRLWDAKLVAQSCKELYADCLARSRDA
jgi:glycosyltransferase involved in cell wall biosynthesis